MNDKKIVAEVISVMPNKIKISIDNLDDFSIAEEKLKIGSYIEVSDNENCKLMAIIESFSIEVKENERKYILEASPLGVLNGDVFERGGDNIAIPPKDVFPAKKEDIIKIFSSVCKEKNKFCFSKLSSDNTIDVPINGNVFFSKHISIVGSTGSGKSNTVAKIIQNAINSKNSEYDGLNNSHIIIFDIHSEYKTAFPEANYIDIDNLVLPYWLLNSDELQELFIDTEANDHNQRNVFKEAIVTNKKNHFTGLDEVKEKIHFDSPLLFDIDEVLDYVRFKNEEMVPGAGVGKEKQGPLNGKLTNFVSRMENKINDKRLEFLLGKKSKEITFIDTLKKLMGYSEKSNVTIIDLSGVPFDVLNITVSLISRILFEYGYYYKKIRFMNNSDETINNDIPLLLVYEEAHKYVPNSDLAKYKSSKESIERIAKEGRKYGITLLLASQRPSEISETIFSQCNNFIAMRLTNPNDQNYVKRLLPDTFGELINKLPSLRIGEAILIGDSTIIPSIIQIDECEQKPSSNDIPYLDLWKEPWKELKFEEIIKEWEK